MSPTTRTGLGLAACLFTGAVLLILALVAIVQGRPLAVLACAAGLGLLAPVGNRLEQRLQPIVTRRRR